MKIQIKHLIFTLIIAVLITGCTVSLPGKTTAQDVAGAAANIADFTLPEDYQPEYTLTLADFTIVSYNPGDGHSHLFLVQAPPEYKEDQAKLEEALREAQYGKKVDTAHLTVIEKRSVTIRGQETTLVISEDMNSSDQPYRQATVSFQGKNGPALLVISEPVTRWDTTRIDQFIASIK